MDSRKQHGFKLQRGDIVHLNSNPECQMTVIAKNEDKCTVCWYADDGEPQEETYPSVCLTFIRRPNYDNN